MDIPPNNCNIALQQPWLCFSLWLGNNLGLSFDIACCACALRWGFFPLFLFFIVSTSAPPPLPPATNVAHFNLPYLFCLLRVRLLKILTAWLANWLTEWRTLAGRTANWLSWSFVGPFWLPQLRFVELTLIWQWGIAILK